MLDGLLRRLTRRAEAVRTVDSVDVKFARMCGGCRLVVMMCLPWCWAVTSASAAMGPRVWWSYAAQKIFHRK